MPPLDDQVRFPHIFVTKDSTTSVTNTAHVGHGKVFEKSEYVLLFTIVMFPNISRHHQDDR